MSLPTTSPLRKDESIKKSLDFFIKNHKKYDMLVSVTKTNHLPGFNIVKVLKDGTFKLTGNRRKKIFRRQQAKNIYNLSTCFYYANRNYINKCKNNPLLTGKKYAFVVDKKNAIDIDDNLDLDVAKFLFKKNKF
jgi:CMP-N-acetylneuraminic acid synthetase